MISGNVKRSMQRRMLPRVISTAFVCFFMRQFPTGLMTGPICSKEFGKIITLKKKRNKRRETFFKRIFLYIVLYRCI